MKIDFNRINVLLSCYIKNYVGLLHFLSGIIIKTTKADDKNTLHVL